MNIKRLFFIISVSACMAFAGSANAVLMLSGDGNITSQLGSAAGNDTFFSNLLQGGSSVTIHEGYQGGGTSFFAENINNYYNGAGASSNILGSGSTITDAILGAADIFIAILPENAYSGAELGAMSSYLAGGGSIFFIGENGYFDTYNSFINDALVGLGSSMSILLGSTFDNGYHTAVGGQIAADPFTAGVSEFVYAAPNEVLVGGGTGLFYGTGGEAFVVYEGDTRVSEPATIGLLGLALILLWFGKRRV